MEEAGSGREDSSHNIPTLDACTRSQVTPGVNVHADGRYVKVYIHTYGDCSSGWYVTGACTVRSRLSELYVLTCLLYLI
jgi:hypothetical protein